MRSAIQKLGPLVNAIENYGKAVDTTAQVTPFHPSPIWGSIRVLLLLASTHGKFYDRIVDTLSRIGDILPRFRGYERIYGRRKHQRLAKILSNAYLDIINLCAQFRKLLREQKSSSVRRMLRLVSLDGRLDDAVGKFRQQRQTVEEEALAT